MEIDKCPCGETTPEQCAERPDRHCGANDAPIEVEMFCDISSYGQWCVRPVGERTYGCGWFFPTRDEALAWIARTGAVLREDG